MKKALLVFAVALMSLSLFAQGGGETAVSESGNIVIEDLNIMYVPSREPSEIIMVTEPLKNLLKNELSSLGYDVENVNISVGTNYEAVGIALSAGTADVAVECLQIHISSMRMAVM